MSTERQKHKFVIFSRKNDNFFGHIITCDGYIMIDSYGYYFVAENTLKYYVREDILLSWGNNNSVIKYVGFFEHHLFDLWKKWEKEHGQNN